MKLKGTREGWGSIYVIFKQRYILEPTAIIDHTWSWSNHDKGKHISYDGNQITHDGSYERSSLIRTEQCISKEIDHVYFEVTVINEGSDVDIDKDIDCVDENKDITIGFSKTSPDTRDGKWLGDFNGSLGYQSYTTMYTRRRCTGGRDHIYSRQNKIKVGGHTIKEPGNFGTGDTIGCGVHRMTVDETTFLRFYFTKNGKKIDAIGYLEDAEYHPTIGMCDGSVVECNFGENPFMFNGQGMHTIIFL